MTTSPSVHSSHLFFLPKTSCFSITRIPSWLPAKVECFQGKLEIAESGLDGSLSLKPVAATVLTTKKKEVEDVLTFFLEQQGLSNIVAATVVKKSDLFLEHLVSRLHILHDTGVMTGRVLTAFEIREAVSSYLEALLAEHGDALIDMIQRFPNPPSEVESAPRTPSLKLDLDQEKLPILKTIDSERPRAMARVSETVRIEDLPPHVIYLIELGLDLEKIRTMIRKLPSFSYYNLERKIKPLVEFLLKLGVPESDIPRVLYKRPHLCGISLSNKLIPTLKYLEELGVDKQKLPKLILRFPAMFTRSRRKINSTVSFLTEMGLSKETIGKVLTRCPSIVSCSLEDNLRPTAKYFSSLGADVAVIVRYCPSILTLGLESNLRPKTEFFLEKGFSMEEIAKMFQRSPSMCSFSLSKNLLPKWEFFLSMGYPRSELVKFPVYFSLSLEGRIKPRYALMKASGSRWTLNRLLTASVSSFEIMIKTTVIDKMPKMENNDF
ncbi:Transcription termination factor MTERF5, chloroplastic-like protein [Drosera capensis]